jgi:hypothetical protein
MIPKVKVPQGLSADRSSAGKESESGGEDIASRSARIPIFYSSLLRLLAMCRASRAKWIFARYKQFPSETEGTVQDVGVAGLL